MNSVLSKIKVQIITSSHLTTGKLILRLVFLLCKLWPYGLQKVPELHSLFECPFLLEIIRPYVVILATPTVCYCP